MEVAYPVVLRDSISIEIDTSHRKPAEPREEQLVYWIHGLGGTKESWIRAADATQHSIHNIHGFTARKLRSKRVDYTSSTYSSLTAAADDIRDQIDLWVSLMGDKPDPNDNFIIAHSQGGLVARTMLWADFCEDPRPRADLYYGGLVTFASAHQGAAIINNRHRIQPMADEGCRLLVEAFAEKYETIGKILESTSKTDADILGVESICDLISMEVLPEIFSEELAPISKDLAVGSEVLSEINDCVSSRIDKVAVYSTAHKGNILWRTISFNMGRELMNTSFGGE